MRALLLVLACLLAGCSGVLLNAGLFLSCGPMPMSYDRCDGQWLRPVPVRAEKP